MTTAATNIKLTKAAQPAINGAAHPGTDWSSIDTTIKHIGREIILPGDPTEMGYDAAIDTIRRVQEMEAQKYEVNEFVAGAPWDALVALYSAMQQLYGVVIAETMRTPMGDVKPEFITVVTGYLDEDRLQVPINQMRLPNFADPVQIGFSRTGAFILGTVCRKDRTRLVEIGNLARALLRQRSIYKGKAISLHVDGGGHLEMRQQPDFIDLRAVTEGDAIHTAETDAMIRTNIYAPLKHTAECRRQRIPLKRGILLEGRYGTGKSITARCTAKVATDNGWTFIMLSRAQGLRAAIEFAKNYQPCVIFAEDIDRAADREDESVNDLVNMLDGLITKEMEMMVVLTTNFIEKIDQALLRPGRFDAIVSIQPPDAHTAGRLIKAYARDLLPVSEDISKACGVIAGQIPATIREVVERAKLSMLTEGRKVLSADDLCVSAIGMKRHMDLLTPKADIKTPKDFLWDGLVGVVKEASGMSDELEEAFDDLESLITNTSSDIRRDVGKLNLPILLTAIGTKAVHDNTKAMIKKFWGENGTEYPDASKMKADAAFKTLGLQ